MKRFVGVLLVSFALVGCGGGDGSADDDTADDDVPGGPDAAIPTSSNPGFIVPDQTLFAYRREGGVWTEQGPADLSCLNTPTADQPYTVDINLTGETADFQTGDIVDNVEIGLYQTGDALTGEPSVTVSSNDDGVYQITLPAGNKRVAFRSRDPEGNRFLDTFLLNQYYNPNEANQTEELNSISHLTANAMPAFIGVMRTEGLGVLAGAFRDCQEREVQGAIATVSSVPCAGNPDCQPEHLRGAQTYYFSAQSTSLPVRLSQARNTNKDGLFVVIELPVSNTAYLQVWGFPTQADLDSGNLALLAEVSSPVLPDSVIQGSLEPYRTE